MLNQAVMGRPVLLQAFLSTRMPLAMTLTWQSMNAPTQLSLASVSRKGLCPTFQFSSVL